MKAMLLAAGRGTRLRPLTHTIPKPMLPVLGKPVMEWLVEHLAAHGFDQIMVNTSYLAPQIEDYFRDGARWGVQIGYSFEGHQERGRLIDTPVGSAGALRRIHDHSGFFDQTTLVVCADALFSLDLTAFLAHHRERRALASIALTRVDRDRLRDYGVVLTGDRGRIRAFQEKPGPDEALSNIVNTGIYLFEPGVIDRIPAGTPYDIGSQLFPGLVAEGAPFFGTTMAFEWRDIGSVRDYHAACLDALNGDVPGVRPHGTPVRHGIYKGLNVRAAWDRCHITSPVTIGAGAHLEPGCSIIGPAIIGPGAVIEAGAHVERSIVGSYTRVGGSAVIENAIVTPSFCVDASGRPLTAFGISDARQRTGTAMAGADGVAA